MDEDSEIISEILSAERQATGCADFGKDVWSILACHGYIPSSVRRG